MISEEYGIPAKSGIELDAYLNKWANQPFINQIRYETNLLNDAEILFSSSILGCTFKIFFAPDKELYWDAEALLAFFERILGTSLSGVIPFSFHLDETIHFEKNLSIFSGLLNFKNNRCFKKQFCRTGN